MIPIIIIVLAAVGLGLCAVAEVAARRGRVSVCERLSMVALVVSSGAAVSVVVALVRAS